MKTLDVTTPLLLALSLCAWPAASGQDIPKGFDVFAEFGPSCLSGAVQSAASGQAKCETGRFFTGVHLRLTRHDAFEVSYSYSPNEFSYAPYPLAGNLAPFHQNNQLHSYSLNYVRYLVIIPRVQPFVTGGVGSEHLQGQLVYPLIASLTYPDNFSQFGWNYGGGIDVILRRYFALRLEFRDYLTTLPSYPTINLHDTVPSLGIVFRFNRDRRL